MLNPSLSVLEADPPTGVLEGQLNETIPGILPDLPSSWVGRGSVNFWRGEGGGVGGSLNLAQFRQFSAVTRLASNITSPLGRV